MGSKARFELALERIKPHDWARFETLASEFIISDFPILRTVGCTSGDGGRDAELFSPEGQPNILFQYSVRVDWKSKIKQTATRINEVFPEAIMLIYVTNQQIGAKSDALKKEVLETNNLILDIHDKSWFLDRMYSNEQRTIAASNLAKEYVDTLLSDRGIIEQNGQALTEKETRAAYVYLTLQLEDEIKEKGLTKIAFQALVRSVLRETSAEQRMKRDDIKKEIHKILSSHPSKTIGKYTDSALKKLQKIYIRHYKSTDEFCLSYQERVRLGEMLAEHEHNRKALNNIIKDVLSANIPDNFNLTQELSEAFTHHVESILEKYLNSRGEKFAVAVTTGKTPGLALEDLKITTTDFFSKHPMPKIKNLDTIKLTQDTIIELFRHPPDEITSFLRSISDSYTLMAFLRETPDVQASVKKLFSHGEIWLDTSIVLPLFAEQLIHKENRRQYSNIIRAAQDAGLRLMITKGILEEVHYHIKRCSTCINIPSQKWRGEIPFLLSLYISSGRRIDEFNSWTELFQGHMRPIEDLSEFIFENFNISTGELETEARKADVALRGAVQEVWYYSHKWRSERKEYAIDMSVVNQLVSHDVENYLGVIGKRSTPKPNPLGYSTWWLTLDSTAHKLESILKSKLVGKIPSSPVLSLDFLANYLTFGPLRNAQRSVEHKLPVFMDRNFMDYVPRELLDIAKTVREEAGDLPELIIRRRVRDKLDEEKKKIGKYTEGGTDMMRQDIEDALVGISLDEY